MNNALNNFARQSGADIKVADHSLCTLFKPCKLKYVKPAKKLMFRKARLDAFMKGYGERLMPSEKKELEGLS